MKDISKQAMWVTVDDTGDLVEDCLARRLKDLSVYDYETAVHVRLVPIVKRKCKPRKA